MYYILYTSQYRSNETTCNSIGHKKQHQMPDT